MYRSWTASSSPPAVEVGDAGTISPFAALILERWFTGRITDSVVAYSTKAITAGASEAAYVLDDLMHVVGSLEIGKHATDTAVAVEDVFALFHAFGGRFAPRSRDLNARRLFTAERGRSYGPLYPMIAGLPNVGWIEENWDEVLRLTISIRTGAVQTLVIGVFKSDYIEKLTHSVPDLRNPVRTYVRKIEFVSDFAWLVNNS